MRVNTPLYLGAVIVLLSGYAGTADQPPDVDEAGAVCGVTALSAACQLGSIDIQLPLGDAFAVAPEPLSIEELADSFDVTVVWSDNPEVNCGAAEGTGEGGCYLPSWPDMVWVSTGMDDEATRDVLLHEIGHVMQARNGAPLDECGAEAFAHSQGGTFDLYECP